MLAGELVTIGELWVECIGEVMSIGPTDDGLVFWLGVGLIGDLVVVFFCSFRLSFLVFSSLMLLSGDLSRLEEGVFVNVDLGLSIFGSCVRSFSVVTWFVGQQGAMWP